MSGRTVPSDGASGDIRYWVIGKRQGLAFGHRRIGTGAVDCLGRRVPHGQVFEDAFDDTGILYKCDELENSSNRCQRTVLGLTNTYDGFST